jgi:hypothetical protein
MRELKHRHRELPESYFGPKLYDVLHNWARYANWGEGAGPEELTICGSAEGNYDIPLWATDDAHEPEPDMALGAAVDDLWHQLDYSPRVVIRAQYITMTRFPAGMHESRQTYLRARRLRMTVQEYERHLHQAHLFIYWTLRNRGDL